MKKISFLLSFVIANMSCVFADPYPEDQKIDLCHFLWVMPEDAYLSILGKATSDIPSEELRRVLDETPMVSGFKMEGENVKVFVGKFVYEEKNVPLGKILTNEYIPAFSLRIAFDRVEKEFPIGDLYQRLENELVSLLVSNRIFNISLAHLLGEKYKHISPEFMGKIIAKANAAYENVGKVFQCADLDSTMSCPKT